MLVVSKKPINIQKEVIGIEEKNIIIKFEAPIFLGEKGAKVLFGVFDDKVQNDPRTGQRFPNQRGRLVLELDKSEFSSIVNGKKSSFEVYIPKVVEMFESTNPGISTDDFEEKK